MGSTMSVIQREYPLHEHAYIPHLRKERVDDKVQKPAKELVAHDDTSEDVTNDYAAGIVVCIWEVSQAGSNHTRKLKKNYKSKEFTESNSVSVVRET